MTPRPQTASATSPHDRARLSAVGHLAAAAVGAALLAGCTVEVVDRRDDQSASSASAGTDGVETSPGTSAPVPPDPNGTAAPVLPDPADSPEAVATPAAPTTTVSCGPDGTLELWQASQSVELAEDCDHVTVAAAGVQLTARAITTLDVEAAGVVVHATSIGTLSVAGADNTVTWDEGSPEVTDEGAGNVLVAS